MSEALASARKFLESLQRYDLSLLLSVTEISTETVKGGFVDDDWFSNLRTEVASVIAPAPVDDALRSLPHHDRKRVAEAIANGFELTRSFDDIEVERHSSVAEGAVNLLAELLIHRAMMIGVATGSTRIQDVNDYYIAREIRLRRDLPDDFAYKNPHDDLWDWYQYWKEHFGSYAERRQYVGKIFSSVIHTVATRSAMPILEREITGWTRVDRALSKAHAQFATASVEEDFQAIGLLCREATISLAQAVFDPIIHQTADGVSASKTDANRMLEAYVGHVFPGDSYKEVRAHHRASLALALNLQHRRTATRQLAALCIEATASTVAVVSIIAREKA